MSRIRWLLWLCCAWPCGAQLQTSKVWRMDRAAPATNPALRGLQFAVLTATQTQQDLILRVGVFNGKAEPLTGSAPVLAEHFTLSAMTDGDITRIQPTTATLTDMFGQGTLPAHSVHTGLLTFAWGQREAQLDKAGSLILNARGFSPLVLLFDSSKQITPIDWPQAERRSPLNLEVKAKAEGVAVFPMMLHAMTLQDNSLELTLSFRNAARFPVTWKGSLNAGMSLLFTPSGERLSPLSVSTTLRDRIAPEGKVWAVGEDNLGSVRFPLPHPNEGHQLTFVMPGYEIVRLVYDADQRRWLPGLRAQTTDAEPSKADAVLAEERAFADLKAFWQQLSRDLMQRREQASLQAFRGEALKDQQLVWPHWLEAPVSSLEFRLPESLRVKPDGRGRLQDVTVEMSYRLATLPEENTFLTTMECDLRCDDTGRWQIEFIDFPHGVPFWFLGYTQVQDSKHFRVLHRASDNEFNQAKLALKQLEKAYGRLEKMKLSLKPRYAAFAVSQKADFQKLTDRDADTYAGAASSGYSRLGNQIRVINQALYLNDYRFFNLQRAWGKQDRQVTIQHELTHLALADITRPWTPTWLVEGAAMHYAEQCDSFTRDVLRQTLTPDTSLITLSRLPYFGVDTKDATRIMVQYQLSGETVKWLVKQHGTEVLLRLYAAYAQFIPHDWDAAKDGSSKRMAALRQRVASEVLAKQLGGLTLEQLDAQVRLTVLK